MIWSRRKRKKPATRLLKFPFPYKSALAFVSDIDTTTFQSLAHVHRCFYGLQEGYEGVDLEFANSFWLMNTQGDDNPRKKNYIYALKANGKERAFVKGRIAPFLRSKLFDTLHTYGQFKAGKFTRADAEICLEYASANDLKIDFWTYHGSRNQVQNIVPSDKDWRGDDPNTAGYHLDLLRDYGVRFFRVPPSLDLYKPGARAACMSARDGTQIYTLSGHAIILDPPDINAINSYVDKLEASGRLPFEKWRIFQPGKSFPNKVITWKAEMLPFQLHESVLANLVAAEGALYLNQHLTQDFSAYSYQTDEVRAALTRLSAYQKDGRILVSSPARLIRFEYVRDHLTHSIQTDASGNCVINIDPDMSCAAFPMIASAADLEGIGFCVSGAKSVSIALGDKRIDGVVKEQSGEDIIAHIPWHSHLSQQRDAIEAFAAEFKGDNG